MPAPNVAGFHARGEAPPQSATGSAGRPQLRAVPAGGDLEGTEAKGHVVLSDVTVSYGKVPAVRAVDLDLAPHSVHAIIGPSGCGKTSLLRAMNRMIELTPGASVSGRVELDGRDIYAADVHAPRVRRVVGMVFQRPNPFPSMSIADNVSAGLRLGGGRRQGVDLNQVIETSLRRAALWDQVKDRLKSKAVTLSGGQQQRLCIARALAVEPSVLLMDEPCSSLDQIATRKIEELIRELSNSITIVIVTHNLQQATRVSDTTAVFLVDDEDRHGYLVESGTSERIFNGAANELTREYVAGRFG